jgi:hypothetical protein
MRKNNFGKNRSQRFTRRSFLRTCGGLFGGALVSGKLPPLIGRAFAGTEKKNPLKWESAPRRLIYIAIDALHPKYLELNSKGQMGGKEGD